jgi:hypothetical protein
MADTNETNKKEIIDYLRNKQKAAEIESKVNGVNIWVILGAIGIVIWQFLGTYDLGLGFPLQLFLKACLITEAVFVLVNAKIPIPIATSKEVRFKAYSNNQHEYPFLTLFTQSLIAIPPAAFIAKFGWSFSSVVLLALNLAVLIAFTYSYGRLIFVRKRKRFIPKSQLAPEVKPMAWIAISLCALMFAVVIIELMSIFRHLDLITEHSVKVTLIALAAFWLTYLLLCRHRQLFSDSWVYDLESELVLGVTTASEAIKILEHRLLGPKLSGIIEDFFHELNGKLDGLENRVEQLKKDVKRIEELYEENDPKKGDAIMNLDESLVDNLGALTQYHDDFMSYLEELINANYLTNRLAILKISKNATLEAKRCAQKGQLLQNEVLSIYQDLLNKAPKTRI